MSLTCNLNSQGLHLFRYLRVQGLNQRNYLPRVIFSRWLLEKLKQDRHFSSFILLTNKTQFSRKEIFKTGMSGVLKALQYLGALTPNEI